MLGRRRRLFFGKTKAQQNITESLKKTEVRTSEAREGKEEGSRIRKSSMFHPFVVFSAFFLIVTSSAFLSSVRQIHPVLPTQSFFQFRCRNHSPLHSPHVHPSPLFSARGKGRPHTLESRQKISAANRGKVPWNKGRSMSQETKDKVRRLEE
jgi:hypothetical protein